MKKIVALICALIIALSSFAGLIVFAADGVLGDVNTDEKLDIIDVVMTRSFIIGTYKFNIDQVFSADMNGDNYVDIIDVVIMRNEIINGSSGNGGNTTTDTDNGGNTTTDTDNGGNTTTDTDNGGNTTTDTDNGGNTTTDTDTDNGGSGVVDNPSGIKLSTKNITLQKGGCAIVYVEVGDVDVLTIDYESEYFEALLGVDEEQGIVAIAIFALKQDAQPVHEKLEVYLMGNESYKETVNVNISNNTAISTYVNNPKIPDFGVYCGIAPVDVAVDGSFYVYAAAEIAEAYGKDKVKDYYQGYAGILSSYGFHEQFNFANPDGGEVVVYLSADGKYSLEYGLTIDAKLGEVILLGITEVPA